MPAASLHTARMPFAADTHPEARSVVLEIIRRMTPAERLRRGLQMTSTLASLTRAGVARDLPGAPESALHEEFLRRWLGRELGEEVVRFQRARSISGPAHDR